MSESDAYRHQILTSNVGPRAERVTISLVETITIIVFSISGIDFSKFNVKTIFLHFLCCRPCSVNLSI